MVVVKVTDVRLCRRRPGSVRTGGIPPEASFLGGYACTQVSPNTDGGHPEHWDTQTKIISSSHLQTEFAIGTPY